MKSGNQPVKLQLKKQAVSNLTDRQLVSVKGGEADPQWTTSIRRCTGFLCCEPPTADCSFTNCVSCMTTLPITTL